MRKKYGDQSALAIILLVLLSGAAFAQGDPSRKAIVDLVDRFSGAMKSGQPVGEFFSPEARRTQSEAIKRMESKPFRHFAVVDFSAGSIEFQDPDHATIRATVEWETASEAGSKTTTIHFVNVAGTWYFANPDFWELSLVWFTPFFAYVVAYGIGLAIMQVHMLKVPWASRSKLLRWQLLALLPATFFVYFSSRPWITAPERGGVDAKSGLPKP